MSIDDRGKDATKRPIQDPPDVLTEDVSKKEGPGWRRDSDDVTGPDIRVPVVNAEAQSQRSREAENLPDPEDEPLNSRVIDRESLFQDQDELYGST